jgi:RNA polymerase sigma-70 factor (ECF subfamily)
LGTIRRVDESRTSAVIQRYLDDLAEASGDSEAEPVIRELLARSVDRLRLLCAHLLHRGYPRLTKGPLNLSSDEVLSAVVERMLKAMRQVRPATVRQFFALASQHMRWELNDLARRLDAGQAMMELHESWGVAAAEPRTSDPDAPAPGSTLSRILAAIDELDEEEREVFNLVRLQGMGTSEAARLVGVSAKTVQRRLKRSLIMLAERVGDLGPDADPPPSQHA